MQTPSAVEEMAALARIEEMKAKDQARLSGRDTTAAREFAAGVEAGLLWALDNIGEIPFQMVDDVRPSSNGPEDQVDAMLDNLPSLNEAS